MVSKEGSLRYILKIRMIVVKNLAEILSTIKRTI